MGFGLTAGTTSQDLGTPPGIVIQYAPAWKQTDPLSRRRLASAELIDPELERTGMASSDTTSESLTAQISKTEAALPQDRYASAVGHLVKTTELSGKQRSEPIALDAIRIVRAQHMRQVLASLRSFGESCEGTEIVMRANELFSRVRAMRDALPSDPCMEVVLALYNALVHDQFWGRCTAEQFAQAAEVLQNIAQEQNINDKKLLRAIMSLEDAGFDTTPFSWSAF